MQLCARRIVGRSCSLPLPLRKDGDGLFDQEDGHGVDGLVCGATLKVRSLSLSHSKEVHHCS